MCTKSNLLSQQFLTHCIRKLSNDRSIMVAVAILKPIALVRRSRGQSYALHQLLTSKWIALLGELRNAKHTYFCAILARNFRFFDNQTWSCFKDTVSVAMNCNLLLLMLLFLLDFDYYYLYNFHSNQHAKIQTMYSAQHNSFCCFECVIIFLLAMCTIDTNL